MNLVEESIVKERLEQELKIAHEAQMKLLPKVMPKLDGFELDAVCVTANEVGGVLEVLVEVLVGLIFKETIGGALADIMELGSNRAF